MEKPKILSDKQIEEIYYRKYDEAKAFSEKYPTSLSPSNFNPNRPADRQRSFDVTHREEVYRAIAQAQLDDTWQKAQEYYEPLIQQAKAEVAEKFQKAIKNLREGKELDLTEREFEVFYSIRNDGISEGYKQGRNEQ
jgi:hypothetical protein